MSFVHAALSLSLSCARTKLNRNLRLARAQRPSSSGTRLSAARGAAPLTHGLTDSVFQHQVVLYVAFWCKSCDVILPHDDTAQDTQEQERPYTCGSKHQTAAVKVLFSLAVFRMCEGSYAGCSVMSHPPAIEICAKVVFALSKLLYLA